MQTAVRILHHIGAANLERLWGIPRATSQNWFRKPAKQPSRAVLALLRQADATLRSHRGIEFVTLRTGVDWQAYTADTGRRGNARVLCVHDTWAGCLRVALRSIDGWLESQQDSGE